MRLRSRQFTSSSSRQSFTHVFMLLSGCVLGFIVSRSLNEAANSDRPVQQCVCHEISCPPPAVAHQTHHTATADNDATALEMETPPRGEPERSRSTSTKEVLQRKFAQLPRLNQIPEDADVFLTFSNGHYSQLMLNCASLVADLGYPIVVLTFDQAAQDTCVEYNIPYIRSSVQMDTADFRQDRSKFLLMGSEKPRAVLRLFDEIKARTVILTDTDTIWMRDPFPFLQQHPQADMFVTTDCLSHEVEVHSYLHFPRCGHVEGGPGDGWALNTGVTVWRNTNATRRFAAQWGKYMDNNDLHERGVDDQFSFNALMTSDFRPGQRRADEYDNEVDVLRLVGAQQPLPRVEGDRRVFHAAPGGNLKLMVLPSALFAGGKTMFYAHLPHGYGMAPYVVHATFQRFNNAGKVARFRESGAYDLDEPEYFTDGHFLAYDNLVLEYIEALERLTPGNITLVHKQLLAADYQLATFRDAAAAARALGRVLVIPRMWAWCDSDQPSIMRSCIIDGAQQTAPWQAPTDLYINMDVLAADPDFLHWRPHNFLSHPRTPRALAWSQASVWYNFPGMDRPKAYATGPHITRIDSATLRATALLRDTSGDNHTDSGDAYGGYTFAYQGTEASIVAAAFAHPTNDSNAPQADFDERKASQEGAHALAAARVLRVQNMQPGMFKGFVKPAENDRFNAWWRAMMTDMKWCCTTNDLAMREQARNAMFYPGPQLLPVDDGPGYEVPEFERPSYCVDADIVARLHEEPLRPLQHAMHPCNFLEPSRVPKLPKWGPELWREMGSIREQQRWRTWQLNWHH